MIVPYLFTVVNRHGVLRIARYLPGGDTENIGLIDHLRSIRRREQYTGFMEVVWDAGHLLALALTGFGDENL